MTDDLKAPERIWITGRFDLGKSSNGSWNAHPISSKRADYGETEYVRADRIATLEAALADMTQQRDAAMAGAVKSVCENGHQCPNGPHGSCCGEAALTPDPDRMLALTAAAYAAAAQATFDYPKIMLMTPDQAKVCAHLPAVILALTPSNALAALSRMEAQAEARGMRKAANMVVMAKLAHLPTQGSAVIYVDTTLTLNNAANDILALADATEAAASEKDATHD